MMKKLSLLIALVLVVAMVAFTVNAKVMPTDPRLERINALRSQAKCTFAPADDGTSAGAATASRQSRLGSATAGPNSRGALVATTWRDWMSNAAINRTVANAVTATALGTQFTYMFKLSAVASDRTKWGWNGWDANAGSFISPGGKAIVQSTAPAAVEAGSYPKIMIYPQNGKGIAGAYDFPDQANNGNFMQMHISFEAVAFSGNFGNITGGTIMPDTTNQKQNIEAGSHNTIWPAMGMTVTSTDTVLYLFGYENVAGNYGAVKVFRHLSTSRGNPDNVWTIVYSDSSFFPTCELATSRVSTKVAAIWVKQTAAGNLAGDQFQNDVYYADSPTGLAGTWTTHDLTNYVGAGYRAWLEASALYDSNDNLHIIWNGGVTDGSTFGSRSCRLFHWISSAPSTFTTIYSAQFDAATLVCLGGSNVMNVGKFSIGECDGRLYTVFTDWNDPQLTAPTDDCAKDAAFNQAANGELWVTVSKDLSGASWDRPRLLSNSYAKDCDTSGNCADDRWAAISETGIDNAVHPGTWPTAATYDPSGGSYTGTSYTQVWYETDRYPGGGILATPQGPLTLNDMRWIRMACVPPVVAAILAVTPGDIDYPAYTKPGVEKDTTVLLENTGNTTLAFSSITAVEDSCKGPGCLSGWLAYSGITGTSTIPEAGSTTMTLKLNNTGIISNATAPHRLFGKIAFSYGPPSQTLNLPISFTVADSIAGVKFDTIVTVTNIKLVVASNGNMGNNYARRVNMNFNPPVECDTGGNSRGDGYIYLGDASPVIVRKVGTAAARASWSIFSQSYTNPNGFKPLPHDKAPLHTNAAKWQQFFSGTFTTVDSLLKVEKTWYAPTNSADTADFVVEKMQVWPTTAGSAVSNLAIGEAYDWDIPTDSGTSNNSGGFDSSRRLVYQKGFDSADTLSTKGYDCWNNGLRYGGSALIVQSGGTVLLDNCANMYDSLYSGYTARNDSFVYPASGFVPEQLWTNMQPTGYTNSEGSGTWTDLHTVLTFKNVRNATNGGWTLPAMVHDTLTVYTVMGVVRNASSPATALDSLKKVIDEGKKWANVWIRGCTSCCIGKRGNINMSGIIDGGDLALLVSYLTLPAGSVTLPCPDAANVNGTGIIDGGDLALLVSYLTLPAGSVTLPNCP